MTTLDAIRLAGLPWSATTARADDPAIVSDVSMCVLASSSSGNCTALRWRENGSVRVCLLDAGLSPRKTRNWLRGVGTNLAQVRSILLTHLDRDHCHVGWTGGRIPGHITVRLHGRHLSRAEEEGLHHHPIVAFNDRIELSPAVRVRTVMMSHDRLGVAAFRFDFSSPGGVVSLGFATDLGHVTDDLVECLSGVNVLAIESNYCPMLQAASDRPAFLKRRITGGRGHLSNHECFAAIERIAPRGHVVLLHLSRQCNRPELVSELHAGSGYSVTIARHDRPTGWVNVGTADPVVSADLHPVVVPGLDRSDPQRKSMVPR
ncbi:MAG: MBL fold metallo-hydrolase [Phycisphaeraceae bacterium]|nr:MBL fold metallo-hydrolase [Phycisphaerae bacterium]MBX3392059.1 MBL fold metallo-hydrolase [Phycisphaeraceae bacterium]HRJ49405.1 MBL fold metallo-hydrolase [Phycisphaerales bacterium]